MIRLFEPVTLNAPAGPGQVLGNRAMLAPMCQYPVTAKDGIPHAWHQVHLGSRAVGGFSLVHTEATAVSPQGRISEQDTGTWDDAQRDAWVPIAEFIHSQGACRGGRLGDRGPVRRQRPRAGSADGNDCRTNPVIVG